MKLLIASILLFSSSISLAKTVARVLYVKGNAFHFTNGKTKTLKYSDKIADLEDIMVEDDSALSLVNSTGHIFHINGGSLVKFFNGNLELKNGNIWVDSQNASYTVGLNTSNSIVRLKNGQYIYSFNNDTGKTQFLTLMGDAEISNALDPSLKLKVGAGFFSLVDKNYNNGLPRRATRIGKTSYQNMKGLFSDFDSIRKQKIQIFEPELTKSVSRNIASVDKAHSKSKKGKIISITTYGASRVPASSGSSPMNYYKELKQNEKNLRKPLRTGKIAKINYHGFVEKQETKKSTGSIVKIKSMTSKKRVKKDTKRLPASIEKNHLINELKKSDFLKSLEQSEKVDKRHPDEVNNLIDELKTYKQDFKKNY